MSKLDFEDEYVHVDVAEFKYLKIKTQVIIGKLKAKYTNIVTMDFEKDPGNIRIGFQQWGPDNKLCLILGNKEQDSYWLNNVVFDTQVQNHGTIVHGHLNKELEQIYNLIEKLMDDYNLFYSV